MAPTQCLDDLQMTMSYRFKNRLLLERVFIAGDTNSNDREGHRGVAQFGDSLMSMVIKSDGLERGLSRSTTWCHPLDCADNNRTDEIERASSQIRSKEFCGRVAKVIRLVEHIKVSERQTHLGAQPTVLKNTVAALIGAVWLDSHDYGTVLRVMLSVGQDPRVQDFCVHSAYGYRLLNHARHHDELQETLLMDVDAFDVSAIPWQRVEAGSDEIDGDYWALFSESDRCVMLPAEFQTVGESISVGDSASTVTHDGREYTPMHTPPSSLDSLQQTAERVYRETSMASAPACTTETVTGAQREESEDSGQASRAAPLQSPQRATSHSTGRINKRSHRDGKPRRPGRPRADSVREFVDAFVVREKWKEQSSSSCSGVGIENVMEAYVTTILDAPLRSQHCLVVLATSIGDNSALLLLREAMQGLRTESTNETLLVDRSMPTDERIKIINHIGACSALLRILRFLHIVTLWEDFSREAQDGSNGFVVMTPSSVLPSTAKKGNPLFLARTNVSQGFSIAQDRQVEVLPGNKSTCGTRLRRLGQRLGLIVRKWGQGALLFLGQEFTELRYALNRLFSPARAQSILEANLGCIEYSIQTIGTLRLSS